MAPQSRIVREHSEQLMNNIKVEESKSVFISLRTKVEGSEPV